MDLVTGPKRWVLVDPETGEVLKHIGEDSLLSELNREWLREEALRTNQVFECNCYEVENETIEDVETCQQEELPLWHQNPPEELAR